MRIETALANGSLTQVERRDPKLLYHKMTRKEVEALSPSFRWKAYFSGTGQPGLRELNVIAPEFFKTMNAVLQKEDLDSWKAYLRWHLVHANAPYLSIGLCERELQFLRQDSFRREGTAAALETVRQLRRQRPGRSVGPGLRERVFPPRGQAADAGTWCKEIEAGHGARHRRPRLDAPETKQKALEKLHAVANKIGYPDKWRDYSALKIVRDDDLGQRAARPTSSSSTASSRRSASRSIATSGA